MNRKRTSALLVAAFLGAITLLRAQVLETFSSFQSPNTLFYGDWSSTGDPFVGSLTPVATFSQGGGFYNFAEASNADSAYVERAFTSSVNLGANSLLTLSLRLLDGNTADSLTVTLFDAGFNTASASFQTSDFSAAGFTARSIAFTTDGSFNASAVAAFRLSGNDPFASGTLSVALDDLSVTGAVRAVPEPSTYGAFAALALVGLVTSKRLRNRRDTV
jgi:hypothetical protein